MDELIKKLIELGKEFNMSIIIPEEEDVDKEIENAVINFKSKTIYFD